MTADEELSPLERETRELLRASAAQLPGSVRSRLTQARFAALQAPRRAHSWLLAWLPAAATATALLSAVLIIRPPTPAHQAIALPLSVAATASPVDLDLLTDSEALALAQMQVQRSDVDYDFYEWAAAPHEGDNAAPGT